MVYMLTLKVQLIIHFCFNPELQVNGELFETNGKGFKKAFFSAIAVLCGDDEIIATKDRM